MKKYSLYLRYNKCFNNVLNLSFIFRKKTIKLINYQSEFIKDFFVYESNVKENFGQLIISTS